MMGQDQFLRQLENVAKINIDSQTPAYGLDLIAHYIRERLPNLKPVCYENMDLSSGLSGNGIHHICGDAASIKRVREALHNEAAREPYPRLLREAQEKLRKIQEVTNG